MTGREILNYLDSIAPYSQQCSWDNSGFMIGDMDEPCYKILVCLDCTNDVVAQGVKMGADIIVSHHPVIFSGLKSIEADTPVYNAIKNNIAVLSCHTNYDAAIGGINDTLAQVLELSNIAPVEADGVAIMRTGEKSFATACEAAAFVGKRLDTYCEYYDCGKAPFKICVCGGAGGEYAKEALLSGCDTFITGEAKHHERLECANLGINLIVAGHFSTERVGMQQLANQLRAHFGDCVILANEQDICKIAL